MTASTTYGKAASDLADGSIRLLVGDCRERLRELPDRSVQCVVTSPPYWGLRDYGEAGQLGLEATPGEYVGALVSVLREARRILRDDGVMWLNLGDSYAQGGRGGAGERSTLEGSREHQDESRADKVAARAVPSGLKPKDLVGIPWSVAFALRDDGWYLRADVIFSKRNVMPESVEDRPTKSHEYVFLLAKGETYYYDGAAISEPALTHDTRRPHASPGRRSLDGRPESQWHGGEERADPAACATRNRRSVWPITSQGYRDEAHEHFAVMPEELARLCVLAGTSERGACASCGAPWRRVVERQRTVFRPSPRQAAKRAAGLETAMHGTVLESPTRRTVGWEPSCSRVDDGGGCRREAWDGSDEHAALLVAPCVVLDPFAGAGTTLLVARELGRRSVGVELSPRYARLAWRRTRQAVMPFAGGLGRVP